MEHNPNLNPSNQQQNTFSTRPVVQYPAAPTQQQMPPAIAKAIILAISHMQTATATGDGEDINTARQFKYVSVNDVLDVAHDALIKAGLAAIPVEVSYADEIVQVGALPAQLFARYGYQFRLVHGEGASWIDERDTRHISILLPSDGKGAGKAQSLALRDYLKGLLRIRTADPDDAPQDSADNQPKRETSRETKRNPPKNSILFEFSNGLEPLIPKEIEDCFRKEVEPQPYMIRKAWEEANVEGLKQLHEVARPAWLRIRKVLDKE